MNLPPIAYASVGHHLREPFAVLPSVLLQKERDWVYEVTVQPMGMDETKKRDERARAAPLSQWDGHVSGVLLE